MNRIKRVICAALLVVTAGVAFAGGSRAKDSAAQEPVTLTLAAAASIEKVFRQSLIPAWEKDHPSVRIEGVYDSSGRLQIQIENGLAADVFFSAATRQMDALVDGGYIDQSAVVPLLENRLVLIKPRGKTTAVSSVSSVSSFETIGRAAVIAVGDPKAVPAGQYAQEALQKLGVWDGIQSKLSLGSNVTEVLHWVAAGNAEAGIVYATDAASSPDVEVIAALPDGLLSAPVIYPAAPLSRSAHPGLAADFMTFLQSKEARQMFQDAGFSILLRQ
jgi:molybdate transport system substrate-binding protein